MYVGSPPILGFIIAQIFQALFYKFDFWLLKILKGLFVGVCWDFLLKIILLTFVVILLYKKLS